MGGGGGQAPTMLLKVAILLVITGSTPFWATVATFGTGAHGAPAITCTVIAKVAGTALLKFPSNAHTTAPAAPTAGVVQANAGPLVCTADTNVVFGGVASLTTGPGELELTPVL